MEEQHPPFENVADANGHDVDTERRRVAQEHTEKKSLLGEAAEAGIDGTASALKQW